MSEKPEITRNDLTAIAFLKKVMDRLNAEQAAYETRVQQFDAALSAFNSAAALAYNPKSGVLGVSPHYGSSAHTHSIGISVPAWEPYLTLSEYNTLRAWSDGDDILIHLLSEER